MVATPGWDAVGRQGQSDTAKDWEPVEKVGEIKLGSDVTSKRAAVIQRERSVIHCSLHPLKHCVQLGSVPSACRRQSQV